MCNYIQYLGIQGMKQREKPAERGKVRKTTQLGDTCGEKFQRDYIR